MPLRVARFVLPVLVSEPAQTRWAVLVGGSGAARWVEGQIRPVAHRELVKAAPGPDLMPQPLISPHTVAVGSL